MKLYIKCEISFAGLLTTLNDGKYSDEPTAANTAEDGQSQTVTRWICQRSGYVDLANMAMEFTSPSCGWSWRQRGCHGYELWHRLWLVDVNMGWFPIFGMHTSTWVCRIGVNRRWRLLLVVLLYRKSCDHVITCSWWYVSWVCRICVHRRQRLLLVVLLYRQSCDNVITCSWWYVCWVCRICVHRRQRLLLVVLLYRQSCYHIFTCSWWYVSWVCRICVHRRQRLLLVVLLYRQSCYHVIRMFFCASPPAVLVHSVT